MGSCQNMCSSNYRRTQSNQSDSIQDQVHQQDKNQPRLPTNLQLQQHNRTTGYSSNQSQSLSNHATYSFQQLSVVDNNIVQFNSSLQPSSGLTIQSPTQTHRDVMGNDQIDEFQMLDIVVNKTEYSCEISKVRAQQSQFNKLMCKLNQNSKQPSLRRSNSIPLKGKKGILKTQGARLANKKRVKFDEEEEDSFKTVGFLHFEAKYLSFNS